MGIKIILTALDKKIKLAIDKKGIFYYEWPNYMEWKNIISTYIKEWDDGENINTILLIFYHDPEDNMFKQK